MEELADLLAEGDPFSVELDEDGTFVVGYDDVAAHEFADLVAGSAEALRDVAGVTEVVHEDRELLLVRTTTAVQAAHLETALRSYWTTAAKRPTSSQQAVKELAAAVAPLLKREGFRKKGSRWNREMTPGFVQVVELGRAEEGDGYVGTVDVALYDQETAQRRGLGAAGAFLNEVDGQVRHPAGTFPLTSDPAPLVALLEQEVLPLLDRVASRREVLAEEWTRSLFNPIDRAIMLALEGEAAAAHALLQERFDRLRHARLHLHTVAEACGLPPLATGSSPERTPAEDALLPAWVVDEPAAVATLRRAFADAGHDARRLDRSPASLDALFTAWRGLVERAQRDERTDASPLMALPTGVWSRYDHAPPADVRPSATARRLAEGLACYLAEVLRRRVPSLEWQIVDTSSGLEPVVVGLPAGPAHVVKRSIDLLDAALRPLTREQERLYRRYNPLRVEVDRWLEGAPADRSRNGLLRRFRRG